MPVEFARGDEGQLQLRMAGDQADEFGAECVFASDIELVKSLLPKGEIIAQTKASEEGAESNFIVADLNQDGLEDVLVISEEQDAEFPDRFLKLYLGAKNGTLKLQFSNADVVRTSDEGGVFGDPLSGLELKKNGAVTLSHFGGSAWKWAYKDTFQFRKGNFVVIGQDRVTARSCTSSAVAVATGSTRRGPAGRLTGLTW